MLLSQGRFWRAELRKGSEGVNLSVVRDALPAEIEELRDLKIEIPISEWHRVVRHLAADRKLLGGILLDFAKNKERLSAAVASDRLYASLLGVVVDATAALVQEEVLTLTPVALET